jgi:long-chain acyl-CoA synthetase
MDYKLRDLRFRHFARSNPNEIALIDTDGHRWSRGELQALANQLSHALLASDLKQGDAVAVIAPNCAEFIAIYFATMQIGLYFVPINWHLSPGEIAYILADSQAKAIFAHARYGKLVLNALRLETLTPEALISVGRQHDSFVALDRFIDTHSTSAIDSPIHGRPLLYTSATTGKPKAVAVPMADAEAVIDVGLAYQLRRGIMPENGNVHLCASMLYHTSPLVGVLGSLNMGHNVVLIDHWEPLGFLELIETHKVTSSFVVPSMFVQLLKLAPETRARFDVSSLRSVTHSAAPCPVEIKRQMIEWWGPIIWEMYGATEGGGTSVSSQEWLKYPGTVGRAIAGAQISIFDNCGNELPPGKVGTIYMTRATGDTLEYKNDPEKTRTAHIGKYFTVGDLGYLNEEGYLFISDRKIDMIICGGANIYPMEIESQLILHPEVADCAVFGIPSDIFGEAVHAVVQLTNETAATAELKHELLQFLSKHLAAYKLPQSLEFATELPRDPSGKLRKCLLRNRFWKDSGRAI